MDRKRLYHQQLTRQNPRSSDGHKKRGASASPPTDRITRSFVSFYSTARRGQTKKRKKCETDRERGETKKNILVRRGALAPCRAVPFFFAAPRAPSFIVRCRPPPPSVRSASFLLLLFWLAKLQGAARRAWVLVRLLPLVLACLVRPRKASSNRSEIRSGRDTRFFTSLEMPRFQEFEMMNDDQRAVMNLHDEERFPKARKPYTISKQREKWTEDEHKLFLESLELHGRAWRRIQEHVGSKTAVQIRSHAQKFFTKVTRESSGDGNCEAVAPQIRIPPPRPKRRPAHPYPRKLGNSLGKDAPVLKQLAKPKLQARSLYEQENGSPKSVLTVARVGSDALASDSVRSPASSVDVEESCPAPRIAAGEVATQLPPYTVANSDAASKHVTCGIPESPILRLFGKRVVVNDLHSQQISNTENEQDVADMELDESAEKSTSETGKWSSHSSAEANTLSPWLTNAHQFMYYLPQGEVLFVPSDCQFFSYNHGSIACTVSNQQAKQQQQQQQPSEAADCRFVSGEGSCSESITTSRSSSVPETQTQNLDYVESMQVTNDEEDEVVPVPGSKKYENLTPDCIRGFVPYKKCTAESEMVKSQTSGVEADREMTRLCL